MLIRMCAYISIEAERIYLESGKVLMEGRKQVKAVGRENDHTAHTLGNAVMKPIVL